MDGFSVAQYNEILRLTAKGLTATAICALGYRLEKDAYASLPKVPFEKKELFIHV
jgi:hypothetical protein